MSVIQVVGASYRHASLDTRERLAAAGQPLSALLAETRTALAARECVVLRTCNRVELYFLAPDQPDTFVRACRVLCGEATSEGVYHHTGAEAVAHLFAVASGLESMVLGEHEILGQVREAVAAARAAGHAGPVLTRLFAHAVRTGKRARRETAISSGLFSIGQCAARTAHETLGCVQGKHLLVFGAGRIAKVAAQHLVAFGAAPVSIFSRTFAHAQELAHQLGGEALTAVEVPEALRRCDILIGCTAAPHHVVTAHHLQEVLPARGDRPLVVIDLGVPRNVDPAVGDLPGVHLSNIDQLARVVASHSREREQEIARVRLLLAEEVAAFAQWLEGTKSAALIAALREKADAARQECLSTVARQLPEEDLRLVDYALDLLVRKLLHHPIATLREAGEDGETSALGAAARTLFGLNGTCSRAHALAVPTPHKGGPGTGGEEEW